jgi:hypothetical protein
VRPLAPLQFLIFLLAGWLARQQGEAIEYLRAENRVLRGRLRAKRLRLTDAERRLLAEKGWPLGRKRLAEVASLATPETILRWSRERVAAKYDGSRSRPGSLVLSIDAVHFAVQRGPVAGAHPVDDARQVDDARDCRLLLVAPRGRIVLLHLLSEMARDAADHDVGHLGLPHRVLERAPHGFGRDLLFEPHRLDDHPERPGERRVVTKGARLGWEQQLASVPFPG